MRRWGVVTGLIAGLVVALWVIALASSGSASAGATQIQTKTVTVAAANELRPGMRLTLPATYHSYRVTRFRWLRCDRQGASCRRIAGATRRVYVVRMADIGHTLRARVTWRGNASATTTPTPQVGRPLPVNTAIPAITDGGQGGGSLSGPIMGDVLTGSNGTWQYAVRFTYQWEDCDATGANCIPILGATTQTYTLQNSDVGDTIVFVVTAYNF